MSVYVTVFHTLAGEAGLHQSRSADDELQII